LQDTRRITRGLYSAELERRDLHSALRQLASDTVALFQVDCNFTCQASAPVYDLAIATNVYRIAQEALTNAVRHGRATRIELSLRNIDGRQCLTIKDNGTGFDDDGAGSGIGLQVMRYRADMIGGRLSITRAPEGGTVVECVLPAVSRGEQEAE
jgi:two-component system CheB/CheR fusion protein